MANQQLAWSEVQLVAVDIGNTRLKLGGYSSAALAADVPQPTAAAELETSTPQLDSLHALLPETSVRWLVSSVHRPAAQQLADWVANQRPKDTWEQLTHERVPMTLEVDQPERVGMDRLMVSLAANHLRHASHAAVVVAIGSAITVNGLTATGAFAGGAILPGIWMAAESLAGKTDALPLVARSLAGEPPPACGRNTEGAIAAGLYWGAVGAVRELIARMHEPSEATVDLFFTGGDGEHFARAIDPAAIYRADMVLLGVALVAQQG